MAGKKPGGQRDGLTTASHGFPPRSNTPEEDPEDAPALGQPAMQADKTPAKIALDTLD